MPGSPAANRGQPAFDQTAQDAIAAARGQPRHWTPPPGYEAAPLNPQEAAEAQKIQAERDNACGLCGGYHFMPGTAACPRLASFELNGDGTLIRGTYWPGDKWAKGRVVFKADTMEDEDDGE